VGAALNFTAAFVVNKLTGDAPAEIQEMVEGIRVPKGAGGAVAH